MSTLGIMPAGGDPIALGQLLRSRRERLAPADVGLPPGQRRRTAGLRREEGARLPSLSTTYYTFLEQGRPVRPSAQVLDALAAALRMSAAERRYLHVLAYGPGGETGDPTNHRAAAAPPAGRRPPRGGPVPAPGAVPPPGQGPPLGRAGRQPGGPRTVRRLGNPQDAGAQPRPLDVHHRPGPRGLPRVGARGAGHARPVSARP